MQAYTFWFTGLSGAGKTTLARFLEKQLIIHGLEVKLLDGDEVRKITGSKDFSKAGRDKNVKMVGEKAAELNAKGVTVICSLISPYDEVRNFVRDHIGNKRFFLIYLESDLDTLIKRDAKGLYERALTGEIKNFTGISDPYEQPMNPDLQINTAQTSLDDSLNLLEKFVSDILEKESVQKPVTKAKLSSDRLLNSVL